MLILLKIDSKSVALSSSAINYTRRALCVRNDVTDVSQQLSSHCDVVGSMKVKTFKKNFLNVKKR